MTDSLFDLDLSRDDQTGDPLKDEYNSDWKHNGFSYKAFLRWRAIPVHQWTTVFGDTPDGETEWVRTDPEWANSWAEDGTTVTEPLEAMVWHCAGVEPGQVADVKSAFDVTIPERRIIPVLEAISAASAMSTVKAGMDLTGLIPRGDRLSPEILSELLVMTASKLSFSSSDTVVMIESAHRLELTDFGLDQYCNSVSGTKAILEGRGWLLNRTQWVSVTMALATDAAIGHPPTDIFQDCDTMADLNLKLISLSDITWSRQ